MTGLSEAAIGRLLEPYFEPIPDRVTEPPEAGGASQLSLEEVLPSLRLYLELLLRWNERTNLTAVRLPEEIVQRHFGESLFAARVLASFVGNGAEILDIGSGAGFPGLPLQLLLPTVRVTLAESQGKKAAFLREAARVTGAKVEVWAGRSQMLPEERRFEAVTMRAVDRPEQAVEEGRRRLKPNGWLVQMLAGRDEGMGIPMPGLQAGFLDVSQP